MVDNFLTSDSGVVKMSPIRTSGTDTTPTSPSNFYLAVKRYNFDYPVFDENNGVDVDVSDNDDDTNIENGDQNFAKKCQP